MNSKKFSVLGLTLAGVVLLVGCGKEVSSDVYLGETTESLTQWTNQSVGTCPNVTGTFRCEVGGEVLEMALRTALTGKNTYSFTLINAGKATAQSFIMDQLVAQNGRYIVDGKIKDQSNQVSNNIQGLLSNDSALSTLQTVLTDLGLTASALQKAKPSNIQYLATCNAGAVALSTKVDDQVDKNLYALNSEGQLEITQYSLNGGAVSRTTVQCEKVAETMQVPAAMAAADRDSTSAQWDAMVALTPSSINLEVLSEKGLQSLYWTFKSTETPGLYQLQKAFIGPRDSFFDDVSLTSIFEKWPVITLNLNQKTIIAGKALGEGELLGQLWETENGVKIGLTRLVPVLQ